MGEIKKFKAKSKVHVFLAEDNQCVWMKAGVVNFKLCDNAFDCLSCSFDKAMSRALHKKPDQMESWRKSFQQKPYNQKECRHMLSSRVQFRLCGNSYQCNTCEFDQDLDEISLRTAIGKPQLQQIAGFTMADDYYYHKGHSWARLEHGGLVRIGVDDFTFRLLGYMSELRLPRLGSHLQQTQPGWTLRREDKVARLLAPVDGIVVATNYKVVANPDVAKRDPYGEGWLILVEPNRLKENLENLLFATEAKSWFESEAAKLERMVMAECDLPLAATGGEMVEDIYGNVEHLRWDDLVHEFLLT